MMETRNYAGMCYATVGGGGGSGIHTYKCAAIEMHIPARATYAECR